MTTPQKYFGQVSVHFHNKKSSLARKVFRLKRSTNKVSCEFSEKSIFKLLKIRVWTKKKLSSLLKCPRYVSPPGEAGLGPPAGLEPSQGLGTPANELRFSIRLGYVKFGKKKLVQIFLSSKFFSQIWGRPLRIYGILPLVWVCNHRHIEMPSPKFENFSGKGRLCS